jgi:Protein of unknown function (DUF664)
MTPDAVHNRADQTLLHFLDAQRASVIAIVDGLSDENLRKPVVPSGWTPLGLIEHLAGAEYYWFQIIAAGAGGAPPEAHDTDEGAEAEEVAEEYDPGEAGPFTTTESKESVLALYRDQNEQANTLLASTPLSTPPRGPVPAGMHSCVDPSLTAEVLDLRGIVLHVMEETARHAGHLDIARELLDGKTGLGPR